MDVKRIPFGLYAEGAIARLLVRPATRASYAALVARARSLHGIPVGKLTRAHVEEALAEDAGAGRAPKSVENLRRCLGTLLRKAGSKAADGIRVHVPDAQVRALGREEAERLRVALGDAAGGSLLDQALQVLLDTGLRLGELRGLRPADWLRDRGVLLIRRGAAGATKSGRAREVDVPARTVPALEAFLLRPGRVCPQALRRRLWAACEAAGLPRIRVHDLRHTRLTLLLLSGAPVLYVCGQAGHHSPAYTMAVYGHLVAATPAQRRAWCEAA